MSQNTQGPHRWQFIENVAVTETSPGTIDDDLYFRFVDDLDKSTATMVFSLSMGSNSISASARKKVSSVMSRKGITAIVITDDALTRGIVTAVSWFGVKAKAFSWKQVDDAVQFTKARPQVMNQLRTIANNFFSHEGAKKK